MFNKDENKFYITKKSINNFNWKEFLRKYNVFITLIIVILISTSITKGLFLSGENILNIGERASIVGIVALGQMLVILSSGIDLSVGGITAIGFLIIGKSANYGIPVIVTILLVILGCTLAGALNGFFVTRTNVPPFMITLSTNMILGALANFLTGANILDYTKLQDFLNKYLFLGKVLSRLFPTVIWLILSIIMIFVLSRTLFGHNIYASGGNEIAAEFSGINTKNIKFMVYLLSGFFCAIAVIVLAYRLRTSNPNAGNSLILDSIAAVVLGGTNIMGGEGNVFGTLVGSIIIAALINLLNLANANPFIQDAIKGLMLIAFVYIISYLSKKK